MNGRDNLEHGWIGSEDRSGYCSSEKEKVGTCAWCGETIYYGEDYGYSESDERLCTDCYEKSKEQEECEVA